MKNNDMQLTTVKIYSIDKWEMEQEMLKARLRRLPRMSYARQVHEARELVKGRRTTGTIDEESIKTDTDRKILEAFLRIAKDKSITSHERKFFASIAGFDMELYDEAVAQDSARQRGKTRNRHQI